MVCPQAAYILEWEGALANLSVCLSIYLSIYIYIIYLSQEVITTMRKNK